MAQTATQRLMAVAIELEDERFTERRRFEQLLTLTCYCYAHYG